MEHKDTSKHARLHGGFPGSGDDPFAGRVLLSGSEVAHACRWSARKRDRLVAEGVLQTTVIGGRRYYLVDSIKRIIERGRNAPAVEPPQLVRGRFAKLAAKTQQEA